MNAELCKLQGNRHFWKEKRSKCGFVTDGDTVKLFSFLPFFFSCMIGNYTIDMSKSNKSVHGFLTVMQSPRWGTLRPHLQIMILVVMNSKLESVFFLIIFFEMKDCKKTYL